MKPKFLLPEPKTLRLFGESFFSTDRMTIGNREGAATIAQEIGADLVDGGPSSIKLHPGDKAPNELQRWAKHPEGYGLAIDGNGIDIYASTDSGYLYAAMTIRQLQAEFGSRIPGLMIGDAPDTKRRGAMLSFAQGHTEYREAYMEQLIPQLARWKINELYVYLETYFQFPSLPFLGGKGAMTPEDVRRLEKRCLDYNIKLIPQLNVLGHSGLLLSLQKYHHLGEVEPGVDIRTESASNLCACSQEGWELSATILADIMDCFQSDIIHVGGDEVSKLGVCPRCVAMKPERGKLGIYLDYFNKVQALLQSRGRKMGIWGDMLLGHWNDDEAAVFDHLVRDTVIYDWHYTGGSKETLGRFVEAGFETVACSTTHLIYASGMWPAQRMYIKQLFDDAGKVGAQGGLVTSWCNFAGLHEEQFLFLHAVGAALLWSGTWGGTDEPQGSMKNEHLYRAYLLQRYGFQTTALAEYWHVVGDSNGPVLGPLQPYNGAHPRRCLFYSDNVLTFWKHYAKALQGDNLTLYKEGIRAAGKRWEQVEQEARSRQDACLHLHRGPLLIHEHLLRRFLMSEILYEVYDRAAKAQYEKPQMFIQSLEQAADVLLAHLHDFPPIEAYIRSMHEQLGTESGSALRLEATKRNMLRLAEFIRYLAHSERPLPAFYELHDMFLETPRTIYYHDREHEWLDAPPQFQRYAVIGAPWDSFAIIRGFGDNG